MERFTHWSAWAIVALILVFAALNWSVLIAVTSINLLVARVQAPTGVILLGLTAALAALFFLATLYSRIGALMEARRLQQELRAAREVADRTEASRLEALQHLVMSEFRLLNERIAKLDGLVTPLVKLP
jgi:uncharacterized integral membrane protein